MSSNFFINVETTIATTSEQPVLLLYNSPGTWESLYLSKFTCNLPGTVIKYYLNPTVSSVGPAGTPRNLTIGAPATSVMNAYAGATYTSFGVYLGQQLPDGLVLSQGYSLLVTATGTPGDSVSSLASWTEKR